MKPENEETTGVAMPQEEVSVVSQSPVERDYTKEQQDRCMPVAIKMMQIMVDSGVLPEGKLITREEKHKIYLDLMSKVTPVLVENGVGFQEETAVIFETISASFAVLGEYLRDSHQTNLGQLMNSVFDENDIAENVLTVMQLSNLSVRRQKIREAVKLILAEPFVPEVK